MAGLICFPDPQALTGQAASKGKSTWHLRQEALRVGWSAVPCLPLDIFALDMLCRSDPERKSSPSACARKESKAFQEARNHPAVTRSELQS